MLEPNLKIEFVMLLLNIQHESNGNIVGTSQRCMV